MGRSWGSEEGCESHLESFVRGDTKDNNVHDKGYGCGCC